MAIELLATDVIDSYSTSFVLDDAVRGSNLTAAVEAFVFWRYADEPTAEFQPLGAATIGVEFAIPFDFSDGREIELSAVARTASKEQAAVNSLNGVSEFFLPNLETLTPTLAQTPGTTATNTAASATVGNFSSYSLHRRIKVSPNSDMSGATATIQHAADFGGVLPNTIDITKAATSGAEHRYVTVEHSSNEDEWGTASSILDITFADSGGGGGGGGEVRAIITSASWTPSTATLEWSAASGSGNYTIRRRRREQYYDATKDIWKWFAFPLTWTTVTTTEAGTPFSETQNYATDYGSEAEVQYQIKRTSQDDAYFSDTAWIEIPAEP